jgi:hypothetical protein
LYSEGILPPDLAIFKDTHPFNDIVNFAIRVLERGGEQLSWNVSEMSKERDTCPYLLLRIVVEA